MNDIRDFWKECPPLTIQDIRDDMALEALLMRKRLIRASAKQIADLETDLDFAIARINSDQYWALHDFRGREIDRAIAALSC